MKCLVLNSRGPGPYSASSNTTLWILTTRINRLFGWLLITVGSGILLSGADVDDRGIDPNPETFWAFQPLAETEPPTIADSPWVQSPMDAFVLKGLQDAGLAPAPRADRRNLIRRVTYDLIGLPPTPAEIDRFLSDPSPEAFQRVVERLLASPRYGEKWGRHWLDVARYADSNGLDENLAYANAFRYSDYVIDAFNDDLPYNRFVQQQLAGDLVTPASDETSQEKYRRLVATGFLSIGPKMLACDDGRKMEMDIVDEQVDTVGRAFMGMTLGCARCHDHKFDPISTADYYSIASVFKSTHTMENFDVVAQWHEYTLASEAEQAKAIEIDEAIRSTDEALKKRIEQADREFLETERKRAGAYFETAARLTGFPAGSQSAPAEEALKEAAAESGLNLEVLQRWTGYLTSVIGKPGEFWAPFLEDKAGESSEIIGRIRVRFEEAQQAWTDLQANADPGKGDALADEELEAARKILHDSKGPFQLPKEPARFYTKTSTDEVARLRTEKKELQETALVLPRTMGVREGKPEDLKVHVRGNYLTLGDQTRRGVPLSLAAGNEPGIAEGASGRLELARWLTDEQHPLTARVMANRIWLWHFGEGLVRTTDNFGRLGELPSNLPLLDWLANRFQESAWSLKQMHRLILLSSSYQMSTTHNETAYGKDPENRLWWRFPRRRLSAEEIRDSLLAAGEGLEFTMHGQRLPEENRSYVTGTGSKQGTYRFACRSVYLPILRSAVYDVFQAFDFPDPSVLNGRRASTTVAPQALFLMNGEIVLDQSRRMAERLIGRADLDDPGRVIAAYVRLFGREPTTGEVTDGLAFVERYKAALPSTDTDRQVRSWQGLCRVLMASNETLYLN